MPGHYGDKKKKKRKATPFDGVAAHGMTNAFKKLTAPKAPKPKAPKHKAPKPPKAPNVPAPSRNSRTGEDFLEMERKRKKKK